MSTNIVQLADKLPSLIQAAFMYAYPGESLMNIGCRYISSMELRFVSALDTNDFVPHFIYLEVEHGYKEPNYILSFECGSIAYTIILRGTYQNSMSILRLLMFLYLTANENCIPDFYLRCPFRFYESYNLEAAISVLSEDVGKGNYDVLNGYISYMDKFGMEIDDIIEACHKFGYNELLMVIMRMLGTAEKETTELRL